MQNKQLGQSDLNVSGLCLGSMTWGMRNSLDQAHRQIDIALAGGINFIDTAELYPTYPILAENIGRTEEIIGEWFARTGRRNDVILATKIAGAGQKMVRDGAPITAQGIRIAVEGSLRRLQTDVIDLYQLHWPNRGSYHFRQYWRYDPTGQDRAEVEAHMLEVLQEMQRQIDAGRIRHFALSNESAWGTAQWLRLAKQHGLPRVQSVQNEYSLLCRIYDLDLGELSQNEGVDLLAFSPLAAGLLSGKYAPDVTPDGTRRSVAPDLGGRVSDRVWPAIAAYHAVAEKHRLDPVEMALAWCMGRPFMGSVIFGATCDAHVHTALRAADLRLSPETLDDIAAVHKAHPMPF
jgi:aryl-alcohol dehydrogenase-like predicted oxidoreductase